MPLIETVMADIDDDEGWATVSNIANRLRNAYPDFDQRTYGFAKLSDLIRATGKFQAQALVGGGSVRVRKK